MKAAEIRKTFLDFFSRHGHEIVPSAPMVVKDDPTLMFTNAGMNQFKDIFLGNESIAKKRVADTQKCLRVSGKHNDLEEVGHDSYHHTMFEMLGNWSFGDYFKQEAIRLAWEFLNGEMGISARRLYATVFEGSDGVQKDEEALGYWKNYLPSAQILTGSKKDNFWEMGETGPCGPCSEIHVDLRSEAEQEATPGTRLVNQGHPLVIEIWNLVFIQYNRKADGSLEALPRKHIDTGLGLERLAMVMQNKRSNFDTDLFQTLIGEISRLSGKRYGEDEQSDIAMRVAADHLRAIAFSIADGQLPSNNKAGYVIRRILRRAVRYGYTFLDLEVPFLCRLVPVLVGEMGEAFPELKQQQPLIEKVIREEESSFLNTLEKGIQMLEELIRKARKENADEIEGRSAFELYDTYGFPIDLTQLILREHGMKVSQEAFEKEMALQKTRSRDDAAVARGDWQLVRASDETDFTGYDEIETSIRITRYRKIEAKKKQKYQLVFDRTPFYAESGGQVGDSGYITSGKERIRISDTVKEHNLTVHIAEKLPADLKAEFTARVDRVRREETRRHHSATHLLHHALRKVLGDHVEQKGSLVHPEYLRFDFSHFQKMEPEEIGRVGKMVNHMIRENHPLEEHRSVPWEKALEKGAIAFFGEKYGAEVRVIGFGDSLELCGGTHVSATGEIGFFKITRESAIAAGIRRIEAVAAAAAEKFVDDREGLIRRIEGMFKSHNIIATIEKTLSENARLKKEHEAFGRDLRKVAVQNLLSRKRQIGPAGEITLIASEVQLKPAENIRQLAFELKRDIPDLILILGAELDGKAHLTLMISENLVESHDLDARQLIREAAGAIRGGGGGQPFYVTAGGSNPAGIPEALNLLTDRIASRL